MAKSDLRIDWATHAAAKYACENWHYSGSVPVPPVVRFGVYEHGCFIGVVIFSRGACPNLFRPYGLEPNQGCELTRIALKNHESEVSKIVAICFRLLKQKNPGLRLAVSFADPMQGHVGSVYQAGGWFYCGETSPDYFHIDENGKKWHSRQVRKNGAKVKQFGKIRNMPDASRMTLHETLGKHRYLMPLDAEMRAQIEPLAKPYPKRDKQAMADTLGTAAGQHRPSRSNSEAA